MATTAEFTPASKESETKGQSLTLGKPTQEAVSEQDGGVLSRVLGGAPGEPQENGVTRVLRTPALIHPVNRVLHAISLKRAQQTFGNRFAQRAVTGIQCKRVASRSIQHSHSFGDTSKLWGTEAADPLGGNPHVKGRDFYFAAGTYAPPAPAPQVQRVPCNGGMKLLQPKLTVGAVDDTYEREADRVTEQVMSMPSPQKEVVAATTPLAATLTPLVQCAPSDLPGTFEPGADFASRLSAEGNGGALPAATRAFMEPRFGADFSGVRLHTGSEAAHLNRAIGAQAFTRGQDIYLGDGKDDLGSSAGKQLLAHELAHTIQQGAVGPSGTALHRTAAGLVQRKPDDIDLLIRNSDWHGAAWTLAQRGVSEVVARVKSMSSLHRRYLVEGARHGEGKWNIDALISIVDAVSHRDTVIGSVRFFVWKHLWGKAGLHLCGLNDADIRRVAIDLRLTIRDMQVMADEQSDPVQKKRLNMALLGSLEVVKQAPQDLIGKGGEKTVEAWLLADPVVGPYAEKRFKTGRRIAGHLHLIPPDKWNETYLKHSVGRIDPETKRALTEAEARKRAILADGFHHEGELYVRQGSESPGVVLHEAIHSIAPDDFTSLYGRAVNEGFTEYLARLVARRAGAHPSRFYAEEYAGVAALARLVGDATLAKGFFTGDGYVVQNAVDGAKEAGTFSRWLDAMKDDEQRKNAPDILK